MLIPLLSNLLLTFQKCFKLLGLKLCTHSSWLNGVPSLSGASKHYCNTNTVVIFPLLLLGLSDNAYNVDNPSAERTPHNLSDLKINISIKKPH